MDSSSTAARKRSLDRSGGENSRRNLRRRRVEPESAFPQLGVGAARETKQQQQQQADRPQRRAQERSLQLLEGLICRKSESAITEDNEHNNDRRDGSSWEPLRMVPLPSTPASDWKDKYCSEGSELFRFQKFPHFRYNNDGGDYTLDGESAITTTAASASALSHDQHWKNGWDLICCDQSQQQHSEIDGTSAPDATLERRYRSGPTTTSGSNSGESSRYRSDGRHLLFNPSGLVDATAPPSTKTTNATTIETIAEAESVAATTTTNIFNPSGLANATMLLTSNTTTAATTETLADPSPASMAVSINEIANPWRQVVVSFPIGFSSFSCVLLIFQITAVGFQFLNRERRTRALTYNLYLVFLSIPDLIYNLFLVYLFATFDDWTSTTTMEEFPLIDHHIDLALFAACVSVSMYTNMVITYEILKLLRNSKHRKRCKAPSLRHAMIQAGCTYSLGIVVFLYDHYIANYLNEKLSSRVVVPINLMLVMGIPIFYMLWVCFRIYWEGLIYDPRSRAGKRLKVLVRYFARIIIVYILLWVPIASLYLMKLNEKADPGLKYYQACILFALQVWVSFALSLTKPDIRKNMTTMLATRKTSISIPSRAYSFLQRGRDDTSKAFTTTFGKNFAGTAANAKSSAAETSNVEAATDLETNADQFPSFPTVGDGEKDENEEKEGKNISPPTSATIDEEELNENVFDFDVDSSSNRDSRAINL